MGRLKYIRDFETRCFKAPERLGHIVLPGDHGTTEVRLQDYFSKLTGMSKQKPEDDYLFKDLKFSEKDIQAYLHWLNNRRGDNLPMGLFSFRDFMVSYLNFVVAGSVISGGRTAVVTADPMPIKRCEPWLREGFRIDVIKNLFGFCSRKKKFFVIEQTDEQRREDKLLQSELEQELGRQLIR